MSNVAARRSHYHHGDLHRALLDATVALLAEVGPDQLSLREAARRVGVSHRAVYRHFADKRALLAAVAAEGYSMLSAELAEGVASRIGGDAADRLVALGEAYVRFARRERTRYEVMFGPRLNEDERFPELETAIRAAVRVLEGELGAAAPDAPSRSRRDAGIALWASVHGIASLVIVGRVPLKDSHVTRYVDVLLRPTVRGILESLRH